MELEVVILKPFLPNVAMIFLPSLKRLLGAVYLLQLQLDLSLS